jgi:hypothetical protein
MPKMVGVLCSLRSMLRDVLSGFTLAAIMGALYALGVYFGPLN